MATSFDFLSKNDFMFISRKEKLTADIQKNWKNYIVRQSLVHPSCKSGVERAARDSSLLYFRTIYFREWGWVLALLGTG